MAQAGSPQALLLVAVPVAALVAIEMSADACVRRPEALGPHGLRLVTERSQLLYGAISTQCRISGGAAVTLVNWSGIVAALGICVGAWLAGATIAGRIRPRVGLAGIGLSAAAVVGAMVVFFA